jgi:hypothetical protein
LVDAPGSRDDAEKPMPHEQIGARFFDQHKRDRGWAAKIVRRERALGKLVVLDVTSTDASLLSFLGTLDKSPLTVQQTGAEGESYTFAWASGYDNGPTVRVQGILLNA